MGKNEIDDRGRITLPTRLRESLKIKPGDIFITKINPDNSITLHKIPSKKEIFEDLIGCIKTPLEEETTPKSIKNIWKI
jgi:AbrB family looped-hinge helix DNA binding protein